MDAVATPRPYPMRPRLATRRARLSPEQIEHGLRRDRIDRLDNRGTAGEAELDLRVALGQLVDGELALAARDLLEPQGVARVAAVELEEHVGVRVAARGVRRGALERPP